MNLAVGDRAVDAERSGLLATASPAAIP